MEKRFNDSSNRWRCFAILLLILVTCLIATLSVTVVYYEVDKGSRNSNFPTTLTLQNSNLSGDPTFPSVFHDLTEKEIEQLMDYLYTTDTFNLAYGQKLRPNKSYVYSAELQIPNKTQTLEYLDNYGSAPEREALVVLFRGDKVIPIIEEYIVGPLNNISYHRLIVSKQFQKSAPYLFRPVSVTEKLEAQRLLKHIDRVAKYVLEESYDASFFNCGEQCLIMEYFTVVSPVVSGQDKRLIWFWTHHKVDFYMLNPVDFFILFNFHGSNPEMYSVEKISYAGNEFDSVENLADAYTAETIQTSYIPFPRNERGQYFTLNPRGPIFPRSNQRSPKLVQPDGPRYSIKHRHVMYLNWDFDFRMSSSTGPQLFDIKYNNKRIAYEISLQEISNFHSGFKPWKRFSNIVYSGFLIGSHAKNLIPGVDCPTYSSFFDFKHVTENSKNYTRNKRSICLFERSTGYPLRRHFSSSAEEGQFYGGLENIILTLRSIITIFNYDYIIDFNFHQNGIIEVGTSITGYPLATIHSPQEVRYGFRLRDQLIANVYQTAFNFKVDIDVFGETNRFQAVDIESHWVHNGDWSSNRGAEFEQLKISNDLKMTEAQATFRHNSSFPQFFLFHNKNYKTDFRDPSGYQLSFQSGGVQLLSRGIGNEDSISWARYNLAVTKRKEDEQKSSSIFAMWDAKEPIVNFQNYIDDNESIIDTDLVAWVTLRIIDIPNREDLPMTQTVGKSNSFFLKPFNYFHEDPSISSRDAVLINPSLSNGGTEKVTAEDNGIPKNFICRTEYQLPFTEGYLNYKDIFNGS